jgi:uncharacterized protein (TIGR00297 family)
MIHIVILILILKKKFLRWPDGVLVAASISLTIYLSNIIYWIILLTFFLPGSLLTKSNIERKKNNVISTKTSQRNALQVIANSLGLFIFAFVQIIFEGFIGPLNFSFLLAGTIFIASASADTWSTEIGTLNKQDPRYILNLKKKIPKGTSGGVSLSGTVGGLAGAIVISIVLIISLAISNPVISSSTLIFIAIFVTILGFLGQIFDSLLGALLQNKYFCPKCHILVEEPNHFICNTENLKKVKKFTFLDNNTVNLTTNLTMSLIGLVLINITNFNPI